MFLSWENNLYCLFFSLFSTSSSKVSSTIFLSFSNSVFNFLFLSSWVFKICSYKSILFFSFFYFFKPFCISTISWLSIGPNVFNIGYFNSFKVSSLIFFFSSHCFIKSSRVLIFWFSIFYFSNIIYSFPNCTLLLKLSSSLFLFFSKSWIFSIDLYTAYSIVLIRWD